jgi:hypothetical protein
MPAPLEPEPIELDLQVQRDAGSGEICWYVGSTHPDYNRHVVSWQDALDVQRFSYPLPTGFFPPDPPLVAHVIRLYKDGTDYEPENRVGNGYMVSVVEKEGRNNYNMYHQVVLQPWIDAEDGRTWDYKAGLCNDPEPVHVCLQYDTGECVKFEYRNACTGSFLGLQSETANRLPATTRGGLTFAGYMDGFITGLSGNVNNANGILDHAPAGFEPYVVNYSWPHGRVCVTYGGDVQPPPEPEPDPDPELLAASFTYSCGNTPKCTFTDASSGAVANWSWTFQNGDPGSSDQQGPHTVTYSSAGKHAVTLQVSAGQNTDTFVGEVSCTSHPRFKIRCN